MACSLAWRSALRARIKTSLPSSPLIGQLALKPTQHGLGRAHDIRGVTPVQSGDVLLADHAPIHDPDSVGLPVFLLHGRDHLIDGCGIVAIAGEDLVAQWKAVLSD